MSFVGLTRAEERTMLEQIGIARFEDLLAAIPRSVLLETPPPVAGPLSEIELRRRFGAWSRQNHADHAVSFMGGGLYDHYIPAALNAIAMRSEFATAYTPYQPEVAQGSLTAIFEFQSMIAELTGMEVANASLYDGATAAVEAALLARQQTGRARVVVSYAEPIEVKSDARDEELAAVTEEVRRRMLAAEEGAFRHLGVAADW